MSFPNTSQSVPFGENNVNLSISLNLSVPTNWSNVEYLLRNGCYFSLTSASLENQRKGTTFRISNNPYSRFVLDFQYSRYHITLKMGRMGQDSDPKSKLVLEICSISTRSVVCVHHKLLSESANTTFVDWYCILGVSSLPFLFKQTVYRFSFMMQTFSILGSHRWKKMQGWMPFVRGTINWVGLTASVAMWNLAFSLFCE